MAPNSQPLNPSTSQPASSPSAFAKLIDFLSGKKTYLVAVAGIIYGFGIKYWHWPNDSEIWAALGFTGVATLRAAIAKLCAQLAAPVYHATVGAPPDSPEFNDSAPAEAARRMTSPGVLVVLLAASSLFLGSCSNMTPEQQAQWSATANTVVQQASTVALDEAAARLRESRKHQTSDNK